MTGSDASDELLGRAREGDEAALAALFARYRGRLRRMVDLRLDRRLAGRVDASDVLQDTYLEVRRRFAEYGRERRPERTLPFLLWLRLVAGQKMTDLHRHHPRRGSPSRCWQRFSAFIAVQR